MDTVDETAIGIDVGTSNTVAVLARRDRPTAPLPFGGAPPMPSAAIDPARCESHPKRCIHDGTVLLGEREYSVEELFTAVFARASDEARRVLGGVPERVAVPHPVAWSTRRRKTLRIAVEAAPTLVAGTHPSGSHTRRNPSTARWNSALTAPSVIPNTSAVSLIVRSR